MLAAEAIKAGNTNRINTKTAVVDGDAASMQPLSVCTTAVCNKTGIPDLNNESNELGIARWPRQGEPINNCMLHLRSTETCFQEHRSVMWLDQLVSYGSMRFEQQLSRASSSFVGLLNHGRSDNYHDPEGSWMLPPITLSAISCSGGLSKPERGVRDHE